MIRLGHIGLAHDHSEGFMKCVRNYPHIFEVVGIAEEKPENVSEFGSKPCYDGIPFMGIDELLNYPRLDAVMVECEELKLVEMAQKCIDKGLHVHMDKPGGTNINEFEKLLKDAKAKKLVVQMGYMYRYNPAVEYCKLAIKSGRLGDIYRVDAVMNTEHTPEKRAWMKPFPGGNMFYLGCHLVDLVLQLVGTPDRIIPLNKKSGFNCIDVVDQGFAVFEYKNSISTIQATSNEINGFGRRQLVVCGSKGTIEIKPLEYAADFDVQPELYLSLSDMTEGKTYNDCKCKIPLDAPAGRYDAMMLDFAGFVKGKKENPYTYEYELLVQKAVMAACGDTPYKF